jgi:hypothetical protein
MEPTLYKASDKIRKTKQRVYFQTATLINSAFALVAALAWNEAIKALLDRFFPAGSALYSKFIYALILTVIVVLVSMKLTNIIEAYKPEDEVDKQ